MEEGVLVGQPQCRRAARGTEQDQQRAHRQHVADEKGHQVRSRAYRYVLRPHETNTSEEPWAVIRPARSTGKLQAVLHAGHISVVKSSTAQNDRTQSQWGVA